MNIGHVVQGFGVGIAVRVVLDAAGRDRPRRRASGMKQVDLKLVIATDVSRSINDEEADIQREGMAEAFTARSHQGHRIGRPRRVSRSRCSIGRAPSSTASSSTGRSSTASTARTRSRIRSATHPARRTPHLDQRRHRDGRAMLEASEKNIVATRRVIRRVGRRAEQ
jgi:hypothetical protein